MMMDLRKRLTVALNLLCLVFLGLFGIEPVAATCMCCHMADPVVSRWPLSRRTTVAKIASTTASELAVLMAGRHLLTPRNAGGILMLGVACMAGRAATQSIPTFLSDPSASNDSDQSKGTDNDENKPAVAEEALSSGMVASLGFYKQFISPLLPPACRFVPTCSRYGVQAIEEFGPAKGAILIAWRLLRCSPIGGKGYDPPKWPPVPYTYSSY